MPNLMPNGDGLTERCIWAKSQPDNEAKSAAIRNINSLCWKVEAPMDSGMVLPPPRLTLSARITRPGRESSKFTKAAALPRAAIQISQKMRRSG